MRAQGPDTPAPLEPRGEGGKRGRETGIVRPLPTGGDDGPRTTCYNRFVQWRRAGIWDRIMEALATAHNASVQIIDTSVVWVHQHGACIAENREQHMGRSRGGLTSKVHAVVDANGSWL
jgi:hypothetical protein